MGLRPLKSRQKICILWSKAKRRIDLIYIYFKQCILMVFYARFVVFYGKISSFHAVIDPNSFGLVFSKIGPTYGTIPISSPFPTISIQYQLYYHLCAVRHQQLQSEISVAKVFYTVLSNFLLAIFCRFPWELSFRSALCLDSQSSTWFQSCRTIH